MNNSVNCCGEFVIKDCSMTCGSSSCCCTPKKKGDKLMYTDALKQIVVLSSPHMEFKDLVIHTDMDQTDVYTFSMDDVSNKIRFVSAHGLNMFRGELLLDVAKVPGSTLEEVLPQYMNKFLLTIYRQTLAGVHLQLVLMWRGTIYLLRTFPIIDAHKLVIAGMMIATPFSNDLTGDINRFSVHNQWVDDRKKSASIALTLDRKPTRQTMGPLGPDQADASGTSFHSTLVPTTTTTSQRQTPRPMES